MATEISNAVFLEMVRMANEAFSRMIARNLRQRARQISPGMSGPEALLAFADAMDRTSDDVYGSTEENRQ